MLTSLECARVSGTTSSRYFLEGLVYHVFHISIRTFATRDFKSKPFLFRHHQPYAPKASLNDKNNAFLDILLLIKNIYKKMLHARNKTIAPLGWYVMMYFIYCESFRVARKERAGFFFL